MILVPAGGVKLGPSQCCDITFVVEAAECSLRHVPSRVHMLQ